MSKWWSTRFAMVCWWIWKWRNEAVFNGVKLDAFVKLDLLARRVAENMSAFSNLYYYMNGKEKDVGDSWGRWQKPNGSVVKVNVDGSSLQAQMCAGVGCVMRNSRGQWVGGEGRNVGFMNALTAEILAIKCGLLLAWKHGVKHLVLECDSIEAVEMILGSSSGCKEDLTIAKD